MICPPCRRWNSRSRRSSCSESSDDGNRRLTNQAFYTRLEVTEDEELRPTLAEPFATIAEAARGNKTEHEHTTSCDVACSRKNTWVDLRREFENPCPHLKTLSLRRSRGLYDHDQRSSEPTVFDSRGRVVRSLEMAQTLLRPEQVDDLVAQYREGATLVELASLFGVNRRTVATHLTRREVTIRRGRFDPSRIHEAAV